MKRFGSYVGYGVAASITPAIPLVAIDWLLRQLPYADTIIAGLERLDQPVAAALIGLVATVLVLALLG